MDFDNEIFTEESGATDNAAGDLSSASASEDATNGASSVTDDGGAMETGVDTNDGSIYSEKGSFRLTKDAMGNPIVTMNFPNDPAQEETEMTPAQEEAAVVNPLESPSQAMMSGNEQLAGLVGSQYEQPKEYTPNDFLLAMQLGTVDESRIPDMYRGQYQAYKQNTIRNPPQQAEEETKADLPQDTNAAQYYARINEMAENMAMKELGLTQEELDMGDYTDDEAILAKTKAYKTAVEANRGRILAEVQNEMQKHSQQQEEYRAASQEIQSFYQKAMKEEPNFQEIDRLMASRVNELPYREAVKLVPVLERLKNGTVTRADLPILGQFYKDTRMEYYAKKNEVGRAPAAVRKPPAVEQPGNGGKVPPRIPANFAKMSFRDKSNVIAQFQFSNE